MRAQNNSRDATPRVSQITAKRFNLALSEVLSHLQMADHLSLTVPIDPHAMQALIRKAISIIESAQKDNRILGL